MFMFQLMTDAEKTELREKYYADIKKYREDIKELSKIFLKSSRTERIFKNQVFTRYVI